MSKNLLIVESPAKAKTLKKFLGNEFEVVASMGHIIDLPSKTLGIDIEDNFKPEYVPIPGKNKVIDDIKKRAREVETVYLSPDPDREGEAIAWHLSQVLGRMRKPPKMVRAIFNEITPRAVRAAVEEPRDLNPELFDAQQARRVLDRLVGYKISPLLWKKVRRGLSAGRVQSVALRVVVERDDEIKRFVPEEYWTIQVDFAHKDGQFQARLHRVDGEKPTLQNEEAARAVEKRIQAADSWQITDIETKERKRNPVPPFITSTLQQDAARRYRFTAKKTMQIAQQLYEGIELGPEGAVGLITYMRTDSVRVSDDAVTAGRAFIEQQYGERYLPTKPRVFKTKKNAQDAHEAIRPTYLDRPPAAIEQWLNKDQFKLYTQIWNRFLASHMKEALFDQTTVTIDHDGIGLRASGSVQKFDGFLVLYQEAKDADEKDEKDGTLPLMQKDDPLERNDITADQHFTQPPPHFTEASLIRYLEEKGIGRPSTYASILSTLVDKSYVERVERRLISTALGQMVSGLLIEAFPEILDIGFTAELEGQLDRVEEGELAYSKVMQDFYNGFEPLLHKAEENMPNLKVAGVDADMDCPDCGSPVKIRIGKAGEFLACSAYPECRWSSDFERQLDGTVKVVEAKPEELEDRGKCPDCAEGRLVAKRTRRGNRFIACTSYPACKHAEPYTIGVPCPDCEDGQLAEKAGKKKVFYGCSNYPKCRHVAWDLPVQQACPECKYPYMLKKVTKSGSSLLCPNQECAHRIELQEEEVAE